MAIDKRKNDHIYLAASEISQVGASWLEEVFLVHNALPEIDLSDVDLSTRFGQEDPCAEEGKRRFTIPVA
jgi:isopentenyl-diphosphate delta-isomerase